MGIWFARRVLPQAMGLVEVAGYAGDEHPDGVTVDDVAERPDRGEPVVVCRSRGRDRVSDVHVARWVAPNAPPLWYVESPEPAARPPAMTLIAFAAADVAPGSVIDQATFTGLPVRSDAQTAALRWWTGTGQIHQIYVAPAYRRRGIAAKLVLAAGGYRVARGWAPLWAGGERTDLGEAIAAAAPAMLRGRITPRTRSLPPMTPPPGAG